MKIKLISICIIGSLAGLSILSFTYVKDHLQKEPWREEQLIEPAELVRILNDPKEEDPIIFNIGPVENIKNSIEIGAVRRKEYITKLKVELSEVPKNKFIVIYCGCCPFKVCPNVRPAFKLLNKKGFNNHKLLNISKNIKVDWINKGYPLQEN